MTERSRGFPGAVLKLLGARDYELTVTRREEITQHYLRLGFRAGGLLNDRAVHPTMWIRLWFPDGDRLHQRAFTLVNPNVETDSFDIEFALHDGRAAHWAREAQVGDTIVANVLGSKFRMPDPAPSGYVIVGDTASLPAINTLLPAIGDVPAHVWLEWVHDDDRDLPVAATDHTTVNWIERTDAGSGLVEAVRAAAFDGSDHFGWIACDTKTTRSLVNVLRGPYGFARNAIKAQAYWVARTPAND
jgi:NADPH-dependent ferric siderophore reductase